MKLKAAGFIIIVFLLSVPLYAREVTILGGIDNSSFSPFQHSRVGTEFKPSLAPFAKLRIFSEFDGPYNGVFSYSINYDYDPMFRSVISGRTAYNFGHLFLGFGVFIGFDDFAIKAVDVGFSGHFGFFYPDAWFLALSAGSSVLGQVYGDENVSRLLIGAQFGFWLPHIFSIFEFTYKDYAEQSNANLKVETTRMRFQLRSETYSKNVPYRIVLMAGYQILTRTTTDGGYREEPQIKPVLVGGGFNIELSKTVRWHIEAEIPIDLEKFADTGYLYKFWTGFTYTSRRQGL
ncbi:hypothetical protein AGMMS50212_11410 [Spirochaetia bacterium]|nr:hypothetical protein AGMMS50212_11410 [Spirochaetia bacterium]